ncbi:LysR substrate-binding domain-containing protein [Ensifer sp. SSB1]|jgi:LysR family glycine cleavage system transcriptional activator|uniref:LysR substrate-binding domain-containing protein n=1 Tax=Ensifer sp. SSB1 TaxID=2795385 RepID=UPI001A5ECE77|nr:LysR substrate-binding domain-containing protein [Ensifer sp. SSB1]MBK5567082.1 LysR family transcriptional regulator [Ensifer sp. SSB1]
MHRLRDLVPSANYLFVFEAAARRLSFTAAAQELHVTQPAVSKSIKLLEEATGLKLFRRESSRLELTAEGQRFYAEVQGSLDHLYKVIATLQKTPTQELVRVCFSASFVQFWLLPRLHDFKERYPTVALRIEESSRDDHNLNQEDIDVSARLGDGGWPGIDSWPIFEEEIMPICSPDYLSGMRPATCVADLINYHLLDVEEPHRARTTWRAWLLQQGVPISNVRYASVFTDILGAIEAAVHSQGIALGWRHIVDSHLNAGRLVVPFPVRHRTGHSVHITMPGLRPRKRGAELFRDWLLEHSDQHVSVRDRK